MVVDFVEIGNGTDEVCSDVSLVVECLETTPYAKIFTFFWEGFGGSGVGVAVDELLHVDDAGAVVEGVGCVCGLGGDGVDLADEGQLW